MSSFLYRKVIKKMHVYNLHKVMFSFIMAQKIVRPTVARLAIHTSDKYRQWSAVLREKRLVLSRRNLLSTRIFHPSSTSSLRTASLPKRLISPITWPRRMAIYLLKPRPPCPAIYQLCRKLHRAHSIRTPRREKFPLLVANPDDVYFPYRIAE